MQRVGRGMSLGGLIGGFVALACLAVPAQSFGAAATIVNTATGCNSSVNQASWLVSCASQGADGDQASGRRTRISALVSHDKDETINNFITTEWGNAAVTRATTCDTPSIQGGYGRSRCDFTFTHNSSGTGLSGSTLGACGTDSNRRYTDDKVLGLQAKDAGGTNGTSVSSIEKFVAADHSSGCTEPGSVYSWNGIGTNTGTFGTCTAPTGNNFDNSIVPGTTLTFCYKGQYPGGGEDFNGISWRLRNLRDGTKTTAQTSCPGGGDGSQKGVKVTFPDRGAWVVEAETLYGTNCVSKKQAGWWFPIGTADVNSAAAPTADLAATRPQLNGNTTITADNFTDPDSDNGGGVQIIEWDLDGNTTNGVTGFEATPSINTTGNSPAYTTAQTKTVSTSGQSAGLHTIRIRITDNGAMDAADSIRKSRIVSATYLVDTPPVLAQPTTPASTEYGAPVAISLSASDVDGDTLTFSASTQPTNGTGAFTGSGNTRTYTYTPNPGFSGTDTVTFQVADGFGGTNTKTVTINVAPQVQFDGGGTADGATVGASGPTYNFSSPVSGATFDCRIDSGPYSACNSGDGFPGQADGTHIFSVRAVKGGQTDPTPATRTFTVDTTAPDTTIDSGPADGSTTNDNPVTYTFSSSEGSSTFECNLDGSGFTSCTSPASYSNLAAGSHTFAVRATDQYGNTDASPASTTFTVTDSGVASGNATTTTYTAQPGDSNDVTVTGGNGQPYVITDNGGGNVDAGANCTQLTPSSVSCPDTANVIVNLGDDNDTFSAAGAGGGNFTINGGDGSDRITGGPGNDTLNGGNGDASTDRLEGGPGNDTIDGGPGVDRSLYLNSTGDVTATIDNVANDSDGAGGTDNVLDTIESITGGSGNDTITGSCLANTIAGQGGNDAINGDPSGCVVGGNDFMGGGTGDDGMSGLDGSDSVTYTTNTAAQPISVTLDGVANDNDGQGGTDNIGDDVENVYGGSGDDTIDATDANQGVALWGRPGNDTLIGSTFNDYLRGENGADNLNCAAGANDMFDVDPADTVDPSCETPG